MTLSQTIATLYHPDAHDDIARCYGWSDFEQMSYYDRQGEEAPPMTDNEIEALVEREEALATDGKVEYLAPPPSEILVLARPDPREGVQVFGGMIVDGDSIVGFAPDYAGVY